MTWHDLFWYVVLLVPACLLIVTLSVLLSRWGYRREWPDE